MTDIWCVEEQNNNYICFVDTLCNFVLVLLICFLSGTKLHNTICGEWPSGFAYQQNYYTVPSNYSRVQNYINTISGALCSFVDKQTMPHIHKMAICRKGHVNYRAMSSDFFIGKGVRMCQMETTL